MRINFNLIKSYNVEYNQRAKEKKLEQQQPLKYKQIVSYAFLPISFNGSKPSEIELQKNIADVLTELKQKYVQEKFKADKEGPQNSKQKLLIGELLDIISKNEFKDLKVEESRILKHLDNKSIELNDKFSSETYRVFTNSSSTKDEKFKSFKVASSFVEEEYLKSEPSESAQIKTLLDEYLELSNRAVNKGHTIYTQNVTKKFFLTAKKYWSQKYLPKLLDAELEKMIFVEKSIQKSPALNKLKTFNDLSLDDKYLVSKYYENNNYQIYDDDPMQKILNDRTIENKAVLIEEIRNKMVLDTENFSETLNAVNTLRNTKEGIQALDDFKIPRKNNDEKLSLLNIYLIALGQKELCFEDNDEKFNYLSTLDKKELNLATEKIQKDWHEKYLPIDLDKEVDFQAYKTDIQVGIKNELFKINENIGQIKLKLDKIELSLTELVSNVDRIYAKFKNPVEDEAQMQKKANLYLESMKSGIEKLNDKDQEKVLLAFKTEGIRYLDVVLKNSKDEASKKMLNDLKGTISRAQRPNAVLAKFESLGTIFVMNQAMNLFRGAPPQAVAHTVNALTTPQTFAGFPVHQPYMGVSDVAQSSALMTALAGGATIAAITVAIMGIYGVYRATSVHKEFSDMYFGE